MGETSCFVPETSNGEREVNLASALRESVSFGRFMSESLDWGKWSSFRHNRYLDEVEKYSTPGSVAQKKAYFEAHYKRITAKKSAALQDQENAMADNAADTVSGDRAVGNGKHGSSSDRKAVSEELSCEMVVHNVKKVESPMIDKGFSPSVHKSNLDEENYGCQRGEAEKGVPIIDDEIILESSLRNESSRIIKDDQNQNEDIENQNNNTEVELRRTSPLEKKPLKESCVINQDLIDSTEKKPRVPVPKPPLRRSPRIPPSSASMHFVKEIKSTPGSKKYETCLTDKNRSTPKSLHMSINLTQYQGGTAPLATKTSPVVEKAGGLKVASISLKASQNRLHPSKTPIKEASNVLPNPRPEKGRARTTLGQIISGRRKADAELHTVSPECSKCSSTRGIRSCSHTVSSSLSFRIDERAQKRKELFHNLEDKVNAKESKKREPQGTTKIPLTNPRSPKLGRRSNSQAISEPKSLPSMRASFRSGRTTHPSQKSS